MSTPPLRPSSTAEVAEILRKASATGTPIVATGGATGLADATRPTEGETVLLTDRLKRTDPIDRDAAQVTVGAGVTLAELEEHVRREGFEFPLDLGARQTATIGGMAACNAGGSLAWRFGSMRDLVAGVEAVTGDGKVVGSLAGLRKDNAGYDLRGLLVGSEGTLGVITALTLHLTRAMPARATALIAAPSPSRATEIAVHLRSAAPSMIVCDFIGHRAAMLSCERIGAKPPVGCPADGWLILVELGGDNEEALLTELSAALSSLAGAQVDAAIAAEGSQREAIWKIRDSIYEACEATGPTRKLDFSVQVGDLAELEDRVFAALTTHGTDPSVDIAVWGHLLDGNFHATMMGPAGDPLVEQTASEALATLGGSIAAEHGVGRQRLAVIGLTRTDDEISSMKAIKNALDPAGILAPGRALP